jgi:tetratricopeptide (TPR) repeat protein
MEQGMYARARQRFEYVIQLDPNYPGVTEKLAEVLLELNTTATPTLLPSATLTPTPDTRDSQQRFDQAQQGLAANDWTATIDSLLALRKLDPSFRAVEIDGMLFLALRNRGRDKILKESDLEGGIYDLTLASQFGPLDSEAQGLLSWSSLYITGASFWGIDWDQAVSYFSQVAPNLPNLMDGSKMTATERLRQALFEQGNVLAGRGQYCAAVRAYQQSYEISPDPKVQQAGELAAKGCSGDGEQPQGTPKPGKKPKATQNP